jgi:hypothetical protein
VKFAYADPPYLGCCGLYDHHHGDDGRCWDDPETHRQLVNALVNEFPDGWALSLSMPSLHTILPMVPSDARVGSWVKTFCAFKKGVRPCTGQGRFPLLASDLRELAGAPQAESAQGESNG